MHARSIRRPTRLLRLVPLLAASACVAGPTSDYVDLGGASASLADAFNEDGGKVRAILLASPT